MPRPFNLPVKADQQTANRVSLGMLLLCLVITVHVVTSLSMSGQIWP